MLKKLLVNSKLGLYGSLVYLLILITIGIQDALLHQSYPQMGLYPNLPNVLPLNQIAAKIFWDYGSIHLGAIFFIGILAILHRPTLNFKGFSTWLLWLIKMLLIGTLIEQATVLITNLALASFGVINIFEVLLRPQNLWTSGNLKIHITAYETVLIDLAFSIVLILIILFEKRFKERRKLN